jgi:hypothetical protein
MPPRHSGSAVKPPAQMRESREGPALVGVRLPFVEARLPYLVNRHDVRRRATSERRFFASSSSSPRSRDGPARPM